MADEDFDDDAGEGEGESQSGSGGKKKLFIIAGAAVLVLLGGGAAVYFTGLLDPLLGESAEEASADGGGGGGSTTPGTAVFHDLPEMIVTLNTGSRKPVFLKIRVSLELTRSDDIPKVQAVMPRIVDNFQVYLRELRIDDLQGSAGMYRLREELLTRVKAAAHPARVNAVLFKEMLVQ